jgi:hypothetical protein
LKILFIDAGLSVATKDMSLLLEKINDIKKCDTSSILLSYNSGYEDAASVKKSIEKINSIDNAGYTINKSLHPDKIKRVLRDINPDIVIFSGFRIPDMVWMAVSNSLNIKTIVIQHGFEILHLKRSIGALIASLNKALRYSLTIVHLARYLRINTTVMLYSYIRHILNGKSFKGTLFNDGRIFPDKIFVYSDFYIQFWNDKFGIEAHTISVMGVPDLMNIDTIKSKLKIDGCCYLAQTLVEDGRMSRSDFLDLMLDYKKIAKKFENFIIKLHPRSDKSLYNEILLEPNVSIKSLSFPHTTMYLSHYSSTVFTARYLSNFIILHELKGDPIPSIFSNITEYVFKSVNDISLFIDSKSYNGMMSNKITITDQLNYVAPNSIVHPLNKVALYVVNSYEKKI